MSKLLLLPFVCCLMLPAAGKPLPLPETLELAGKIDALLEADLTAQQLDANPLVTDDIFLRRTYLGIVGRIPTPQEAMTFLGSDDPHKRTKLIEKLVASPGYESSSFNYFADLLRLQTNKEQYGLGWHVWLRQSIAEDKPWTEMVHEMLAANGHNAKNPAVGYYLRDRGMLLDNVSNTMQVFLGHQIGCAQCHDHPFDRWTQMEYYELASFSSGINFRSAEAAKSLERIADSMRPKMQEEPIKNNSNKKDRAKAKAKANQRRSSEQRFQRKIANDFRAVYKDFNRNEVSERPSQGLKLPDDYAYEDGEPGELIPPATLFGEELKDVAPEERREAFATWVTTGNPYFAKVFANRLWDRTFGHGLVDPVDNWSKEANTLHPEVLAYLDEVMERVHFRPREFERVLYHTKLFQRSVALEESTPGTAIAFQGPQLRRMRAEEMYDSLLVLTYGNVDDNINTGMTDRWETYRKNILKVMSASPAEIIKLDARLDKIEAAKVAYQKQNRELAAQIREARQAGNKKRADRLEREQSDIRRAYAETRQSNSPATMVSMRNLGATAKPQRNMRASEYPTPFRGDHLVRQFGGSDRQIPEASDDHASIPQALTLLNGYIATTTENKKSKTFEALAEISSPETRLDYLFLAYYGAYPTPEEQEQFLPLAGDKDSLFTLARAMLTSKRFLFVQ